ncbi:MAG: B-box zinc finger protein [Deltaproteobacteria bacterium]|nr:B-box zinc finger protein [Deltaproteobacteria bacterium]
MVAAASGPRCPEHPDAVATLVCSRCHKPLCERCAASSSPPVCLDCALREPDVVADEPPLDVVHVLKQSASLLAELAPQLLIGMVILFGVQLVLALILGVSHLAVPVVTRVMELLTGAVFAVYVMCLARERRAGHEPKVLFCLQETAKLADTALTAMIFLGVVAALGLVLLVAPGLMVLSHFAVAPAVAVFEPGSKAALRAVELSKGNRGKTLALGLMQVALIFGLPSVRHALAPLLSGHVPAFTLAAGLYALQWTAAAYAALLGYGMYTGLVAAARQRGTT